ncbi:glycoside hydrolase family 5 protein [Trametes coccinea BRFM310]|uniref:glucan 1,3-beta-glucosidase n=1 Tax=Trametes coccinea (strain BRFM310) TaxID=1353009 RepID=A0A1Y2J5P6_TRAC3|nr:glycoside hydrolase family 5 protein [Trametes coccinea BRFM310]
MSGTSYQPVFNASTNNLHAQDRYEDVRDTQFYTPETEPLELHQDELPAGAAPPRFMGAARHDAGNRASFASSQGSVPTVVGDDYEGSTDALNQKSRGFYGLNYDDSEYNASQPAFDGRKTSPTTSPYLNEKRSSFAPRPRSRRKAIIIGSLVALAVIIAAVVLGVYFAVIKPKQNDDSTSGKTASGASADGSSDTSGNSNSGSTSSRVVISGGDGSTVTMFDGSTFTYTNKFGGTWYYDPANPTTSGARPQSWTPALNETFNFGQDPIRGVNLGGWLVTEPFIVPALYEKYVNTSDPAVDEWTLTQKLQADGALSDLEDHYKTFVTEQDFAEIAAAGLNFVRIPIPYWAIEVRENEPFLPKTQWTYFLKAVQWARKYGLRINLDLHSLPGSQNGWNHSGRLGDINVLLGPMGIANAERSLDYIRIIAEFISQPEYKDVIPLFGITNEPFGPTIGEDAIQRYYLQAYNIVRNASGTGEGHGPWVVFHDAFFGLKQWAGFLPNADRTQLDIHQYVCFGAQSADDYGTRVQSGQPCSTWGAGQNDSMTAYGMTHVGEWSLAINDCGQWVNGVNLGARFDGTFTTSHFDKTGDCSTYTDYTQWDAQWKADMKQFALQSMSALQNWFFWTWKIGNSTVTGRPPSPAWSYQLGLQEGWMPTDPRDSEGVCENTDPFNPPLQAWMTGGTGAGQIPATAQAALAWPPSSLTDVADIATLPQYTQTGALVSLPAPTLTASAAGTTSVLSAGSWNNPSDTASMWVPVATCGYLDPWMGPDASTPACPSQSATARRREAYAPRAGITPAPVPSS